MKKMLCAVAVFTAVPSFAIIDPTAESVTAPRSMPTPSAPPAPSYMAPAFPQAASALPTAPGGPAAVNPSAQKLSRELNEERAKATEQQQELEKKAREITKLKSEKAALIEEKSSLEKRLKESKEAVQAAEVPDSQDQNLRRDIELLRNRISQLNADITLKDRSIGNLTSQKEILEATLRDKNSEITRLKDRISELLAKKNEAVASVARQTTIILELQRSQGVLSSTIENLRATVARLEGRREGLEQENTRLHGRTSDEITYELQRKKDVLQTEIVSINTQIATAREQLARINQEVEQRRAVYRVEIAQHTATKNGIQAEHQRFADKIKALKATPAGHFDATVQTLEQTIHQLRNDVTIEQRAKTAAQSQSRSLQFNRKYDVIVGALAGSVIATYLTYVILITKL